jgi:hypothetical protein
LVRLDQLSQQVQDIKSSLSPLHISGIGDRLQYVNTADVLAGIAMVTTWVMDSGCTAHMCCDRLQFITMRGCPTVEIRVADGRHITASQMGTVELRLAGSRILSKNTLFVPQFSKSLFSIRVLDKNGGSSLFKDGICTIMDKSGRMQFTAPLVNGLYTLVAERKQCLAVE